MALFCSNLLSLVLKTLAQLGFHLPHLRDLKSPNAVVYKSSCPASPLARKLRDRREIYTSRGNENRSYSGLRKYSPETWLRGLYPDSRGYWPRRQHCAGRWASPLGDAPRCCGPA